jgi:hypothetical protein
MVHILYLLYFFRLTCSFITHTHTHTHTHKTPFFSPQAIDLIEKDAIYHIVCSTFWIGLSHYSNFLENVQFSFTVLGSRVLIYASIMWSIMESRIVCEACCFVNEEKLCLKCGLTSGRYLRVRDWSKSWCWLFPFFLCETLCFSSKRFFKNQKRSCWLGSKIFYVN